MAWATPMTATNGLLWTHTLWNTHIRDNFNETCAGKATTAGRWFVSSSASGLAEREIASDSNTDDGTTTSTSYTSTLTGSVGNCTVTLTTGTAALCFFGAMTQHSSSSAVQMVSVAVSGATTIAANDNWCAQVDGVTAANNNRLMSVVYFGSGGDHGALTAGSNTFTVQYRTSSGTLTVNNGEIIVFAM
jgi:hypothetical protein